MPSGLSCVGGAGDQAEQHVADMRDRRVGEQSLGIGLRERGEIRSRHGGDGDEHQQRHPDRSACGISPHDEDAQQHRPSGGLDRDRHESGDAGGRAFVGVRRPLVEGNRGDLEQQPGDRREQRNDRRPAGIRCVRTFASPDSCWMTARFVLPVKPVEQRQVRRRRCPRKMRRAADISTRLRSIGGRGAGIPPARKSKSPSIPGQ